MSVVANLAINLDARGAAAQLQQFQQRAQATQQATERLGRAVDDARRASEASQPGYIKLSQALGVLQAKVKNTEAAIRSHIASLREVQSRVEIGGGIYKRAAGQIAEYEARLKLANGTQQQAASSSDLLTVGAGKLSAALAQIAAAYLSVTAAQRAFQAGIQREESERRLAFLANAYGEVQEAQRLAAESGRRFGLSATESNQQFAQLYGRLRALNVPLEDINTAFIGFNTQAKISGTTSAESAGALLQLTQALGSGVLRGQELNSVLEQAPGLVVAITKELNVPVGQIRKLAEQGKITSDVVIRALKRAGDEGAGQLAAAMQGPAQQLKNLSNETENLNVAISRLALPAVISLIQQLTQKINQGTDFVINLGDAWSYASSRIAPFINGLEEVAWYLKNLTPPGWLFQVFQGVGNRAGQFVEGLAQKGRIQKSAGQQQGPTMPARLLAQAPRISQFAAQPDAGKVKGRAAKTPKQAPENRTDALMTELRGLIAVGQAQDKIRDLQFQGRDVLAASVELEQELGQIERDRIEAIKGANYETERTVINKIAEAKVTDAKLRTEDRIRDITNQRFQAELQIQQAIRDTVKPFEDIRNAQAEHNQYQQNYLRLVMEGMLPAEAQQIANFDQMIRLQLQAVEHQIDITQAAITEAKVRKVGVDELQKELDLLKKKRDAIKGEAAKGPGQGPSNQDRLKDAIADVKGQLNELTDPINQIISAATAIGDAFANSFKGLISGSMSAKEALRSFFEATASHFLDMAAQIIAKQIQMFILNTALSFLGGSMGGGGGTAAAPSFGGSGFNPKAFTPGLKLFAEGGFVTRPTNALIGEAGEAEYVIPASKMRGAMERYAAGARGDSVISGAGGGSTATTATGGGPLVVEVRAQMERINSVDYVTAEQFQAGIRQAAQQGAAQGEQRTLRRLQHSPATRRRVGV